MEGVFIPKTPTGDDIAEEIKDEEECKLATCVQEIATAMFRLVFQFGEKGFIQREFILYLRGLMRELTGKASSVNQQPPTAPQKAVRFPSPMQTREPSPTRPHPVAPNRNEMNDTQRGRRRLFSLGQSRSASEENLCQPLSDSVNTTAGSGLRVRLSSVGSPPRNESIKSSPNKSPKPTPVIPINSETFIIQEPRRRFYYFDASQSGHSSDLGNTTPFGRGRLSDMEAVVPRYSPSKSRRPCPVILNDTYIAQEPGRRLVFIDPDVRQSPVANIGNVTHDVRSPVSRRRLSFANAPQQWKSFPKDGISDESWGMDSWAGFACPPTNLPYLFPRHFTM